MKVDVPLQRRAAPEVLLGLRLNRNCNNNNHNNNTNNSNHNNRI